MTSPGTALWFSSFPIISVSVGLWGRKTDIHSTIFSCQHTHCQFAIGLLLLSPIGTGELTAISLGEKVILLYFEYDNKGASVNSGKNYKSGITILDLLLSTPSFFEYY